MPTQKTIRLAATTRIPASLKNKKRSRRGSLVARNTQARLKSSGGLHSLMERRQARDDAKTLYLMATGERGTVSEMRRLVRHDSIIELITIAIDQGKRARHIINSSRSRAVAISKKDNARAMLCAWLDKKSHHFTRKPWFERCYYAIKRDLPNLKRSRSWVQKEVSRYRSNKRK